MSLIDDNLYLMKHPHFNFITGGPLIVFNTKTVQYLQVGIVTGGVSTNCGDQDFPGVYVRLDHPDILTFIMKKRNEALYDQFGK